MTSTAIAKFEIDEEFQRLMPSLREHELKALRESIIEDGVRDALIVWNGLLLDGHNRSRIADELGIEYEVLNIEFETRDEAREWMLTNALARRNLDPRQASYTRGMLANLRKGDRSDNLTPGPCSSKHQNDASKKTAASVAAETGVSQATVERDMRFARNIDAVAKFAGPGARDVIEELRPLRFDVELLVSERPSSPSAVRELLEAAAATRKAQTAPKDEERPFIQKSIVKVNTYTDIDGSELVKSVELNCGHTRLMSKRTPAGGVAKSAPCVPCGSGNRTPVDQRKAERSRRSRVDRVLRGASDEARAFVSELVAHIEKLSAFRHPDQRVVALLSKSSEAIHRIGLAG